LERSLKTMGLRVKAQNANAMHLARYLDENLDIEKVYYPGLPSHPDHELAKAQMHGYGGMLSFELNAHMDASEFQKELRLIKPVMSLAGVESTVISPAQTSHASLSPEERHRQGISDGLIRFSLGIEEPEDLIADIEQALHTIGVNKKPVGSRNGK
jgi:cystathionine beta-lyase